MIIKNMNGKVIFEGNNLSNVDLRYADLSGANLSGVDLSRSILLNANLTKSNLTGAFLSATVLLGANLCNADLSDAFLPYAYLQDANLRNANLTNADLSAANLSYADLSGAILIRSNLLGANLLSSLLSGADLSGADLSYAILSGANLSSANLEGVKGLVKKMGVEAGNYYWKRFDEGLKNNDYKFKVGLNKLKDGEIFNNDPRVLCAYPGFHFASKSWCAVNYPNRPLEALIKIPEKAEVNEPYATNGKASADMIEIIKVYNTITGEDVTEKYQ